MNKLKIDKKTIIAFLLTFVIATSVLLPVRAIANKVTQQTVFNPSEGHVLKEDMQKVPVDSSSPFYEAFSNKNRFNFLLLGVAEKNTDTIMVASYETEKQSIDIISIPRDTYYPRSGYKNYAYNKINSIYKTEDIVGLATAVSEKLYGMPIDYYVIVEYEDIRKIMDAIGGVTVNVPFHMKYDDPTADPPLHIDIKKGEQLIDSSNVEQYLRFRHGNPGYQSYFNGDLGRIQAQQEFVKLVMKKCLTVGNIAKVAKVTLQNVQSDITYQAVTRLAKLAASGLSVDNVNSHRLPGNDKTINGLSFWVPDDKEIYSMLQGILIPVQDEVSSGSAVSGAAVTQQ